jgi:hypothetical protein
MFLQEIGTTSKIIFLILGLVGFWAIIFTLISHMGGWASLAEKYRCQETFTGPRWSFEQGQMRWMVGYNHCLTIGADPRGLYLSILFPFRIAHPPLFIPWRDISHATKKFLWVTFLELRLGHEPVIPLRISAALGQKVKTAAGASWPPEAID